MHICHTYNCEAELNIKILFQQTFTEEFVEASTLIARHSRAAYSRPKVIVWSLLYAAALALFVQAQIYMQLLWSDIQSSEENPVSFFANLSHKRFPPKLSEDTWR